MSNEQLLNLRKDLISICTDVSLFIQKEIEKVSLSDIETKDLNSLVSYVDKEAEEMIVSNLQKILPEADFITEENTISQSEQKENSLTWIIDPLDGTTNFLHKIPHFSISIALMNQGVIMLGIVYEIMLDKAFTAIKNMGAWEDDKPIAVKPTSELEEAIVVTGFPYKRDQDIEQNLAILKYCILNCRGIRRLGSAALDLAYVASGKIDIYYEKTLNIWDIAAGVLLVNEAGGTVSGFNGMDCLKTGSIIAGNKLLQPKIEKVINSHIA